MMETSRLKLAQSMMMVMREISLCYANNVEDHIFFLKKASMVVVGRNDPAQWTSQHCKEYKIMEEGWWKKI